MSDNQDSDSEVNFNLNNQAARDLGEDQGGRGDDNFPRHTSLSHIKPDAYTGEEDWEQYISYFEDCAELCNWTEREKLLYLTTSLRQQARVYCSSLAAEEKNSYRSLVYNLEQRFGNKRQQSRWISKLQSRTRGRDETVAAFGDEIRLYSQRAYVTLDQEAQEMLALQQFYKNVSPEMRCRLMDRDCRTIREAVEIVERYEEVIGKADGNVRMSHARGVSESCFDTEQGFSEINESKGSSKEIEGIQSTLKRIDERLTMLENKDRQRYESRVRTCYNCGSSSHLYRSCPNQQEDEPRPEHQGNGYPSRR